MAWPAATANPEQAIRERLDKLRALFPQPLAPARPPPQQKPSQGAHAPEVRIVGERGPPPDSSSPARPQRLEDEEDDDEGTNGADPNQGVEEEEEQEEEGGAESDDDDSGFVVSEGGEPSEHSDSSQERTRVKDKHLRRRDQQQQLLEQLSAHRSTRQRPRGAQSGSHSHSRIAADDSEMQLPVFGSDAAAESDSRSNVTAAVTHTSFSHIPAARQPEPNTTEPPKKSARHLMPNKPFPRPNEDDDDAEEEVHVRSTVTNSRTRPVSSSRRNSAAYRRNGARAPGARISFADAVDAGTAAPQSPRHNNGQEPRHHVPSKSAQASQARVVPSWSSAQRTDQTAQEPDEVAAVADDEHDEDIGKFLVEADCEPSEHSDGSQDRTRVDTEKRRRQKSDAARGRQRVLDDLQHGRASSKRKINELSGGTEQHRNGAQMPSGPYENARGVESNGSRHHVHNWLSTDTEQAPVLNASSKSAARRGGRSESKEKKAKLQRLQPVHTRESSGLKQARFRTAGSGVRIQADPPPLEQRSSTDVPDFTTAHYTAEQSEADAQDESYAAVEDFLPGFDDIADTQIDESSVAEAHGEWAAWQSDDENEADERSSRQEGEMAQLLQDVKFAGLSVLPPDACKAMATQWLAQARSMLEQSHNLLVDEQLLSCILLRLARYLPEDGVSEIVLSAYYGEQSLFNFFTADAERQALDLHLGVRILARCIKRGVERPACHALECLISMLKTLLETLRKNKERFVALKAHGESDELRLNAWASMQEKAALSEQLLGHLAASAPRLSSYGIAILLRSLAALVLREHRLRKSMRQQVLRVFKSAHRAALGAVANTESQSRAIECIGGACDDFVLPCLETYMTLEYSLRRTDETTAPGTGLRGQITDAYADCLGILFASGNLTWSALMKLVAFPTSALKLWTSGSKQNRALAVRLLCRIAQSSVAAAGTWSLCMRPDHALTHLFSALCDFTSSSEELTILLLLTRSAVESHRSSVFGNVSVPHIVSCKKFKERLDAQRCVMVDMLDQLDPSRHQDTRADVMMKPAKVAETVLSNLRYGVNEIAKRSQSSPWRSHNEVILSHLVHRFPEQLLSSHCGTNKTTPMLIRALHRLLRRAQRAGRNADVERLAQSDFSYVKAVISACACEGAQPCVKTFTCLLHIMHMSTEAFEQSNDAELRRTKARIDIVAEGLVEALEFQRGQAMCCLILGTFVRYSLERGHTSNGQSQRNALGYVRLLRGLLAHPSFHSVAGLHLCMALLFCPILDALRPSVRKSTRHFPVHSDTFFKRIHHLPNSQDGKGNPALQQALILTLCNTFSYTRLLRDHDPFEDDDEASEFPNVGRISTLQELDERTFKKALTAFVEGVLWACIVILEEANGVVASQKSSERHAAARLRLNVLLGPLPRFKVFEENYVGNRVCSGMPLPPTSGRRSRVALQCLNATASAWGNHGSLPFHDLIIACKSALEANTSAVDECETEYNALVRNVVQQDERQSWTIHPAGFQSSSHDSRSDPRAYEDPNEHAAEASIDRRNVAAISREQADEARAFNPTDAELSSLLAREGQSVQITAFVTSKQPSSGYNSKTNPSTGRKFDLCKITLEDERRNQAVVQLSGRLSRQAAEELEGSLHRGSNIVVSLTAAKITMTGAKDSLLLICSPPKCEMIIEPSNARARQLHAIEKQRREARSLADQASQQHWKCRICTLENELWRSVCKVCQRSRRR